MTKSNHKSSLQILGERARMTRVYAHVCHLDAEILAAMPVTEAQAVRADPSGFIPQRPVHGATRVQTSGSTGVPSYVYRSNDEFRINGAGVSRRWSDLLGAGPHYVASLLNHDRSAAAQLVEQVCYAMPAVLARMNPYTPTGPLWTQLGFGLAEFRPTVIVSTPGVLIHVEHELRSMNLFDDLRQSVTTLLTLGATSTAAMRQRLSRSWGALAIDASYGGTEIGTVATGCRLGHLHALPERAHLEARLANGEVVALKPGIQGELVVTPYHHQHLVLLRYATGDRVTAFSCLCGVEGIALKIAGREEDKVLVSDRWVGPDEVESAIYGDPAVDDYQIETDFDWRIHAVRLTAMPGEERLIDVQSISSALDAEVIVVPALSSFVTTGGVVKSWRRTRAVRRTRR